MNFHKQGDQSWPSGWLSPQLQVLKVVSYTHVYFFNSSNSLHIQFFSFLGTDTDTRVHYSAEIFPSLLPLPQTDTQMMHFPLPSFQNENLLINLRLQRRLSLPFSPTRALRICNSKMKSKREKNVYVWSREDDLNNRKGTERFP